MNLETLLEPKKIGCVCMLLIVCTLCIVLLTRTGTSVEIGDIKINRTVVEGVSKWKK
jgi:hypothetical protein